MSASSIGLVPRDDTTIAYRAEGKSLSDTLAMLEDARKFADALAKSQFVPQAFRGKTDDVMAAVMLGQIVGLNPLQALQGIAVINGRPTLWGDAALAVVRSHPDFEDITEMLERPPGSKDDEAIKAICTVKRRGQSPVVREFSVADAKLAGLWGKAGPWKQYPKRMLAMRARGFAIRDAFADALTGMQLREEAEDYHDDTPREARNVTPMPDAGTGRTKLTIRASHQTIEGDHSPNVVADPGTHDAEDESQEVPLAAAVAHVAEMREALIAKLTTINGEDLKSVCEQLRALGLRNNAAIKACDDPDILRPGLAILANALGEPSDADLDAAEVQ